MAFAVQKTTKREHRVGVTIQTIQIAAARQSRRQDMDARIARPIIPQQILISYELVGKPGSLSKDNVLREVGFDASWVEVIE